MNLIKSLKSLFYNKDKKPIPISGHELIMLRIHMEADLEENNTININDYNIETYNLPVVQELVDKLIKNHIRLKKKKAFMQSYIR